jgi:hypothetical protein
VQKVFLSVSFSSKVDESGQVRADYRQYLEGMIGTLEALDCTVFCAPRAEGWVLNYRSPHCALADDLNEIDHSNIFMAILEENISAGIQLELGYALGKGKRVVLIKKKGIQLVFINQGVAWAKGVTLIEYDDGHDLQRAFLEMFSERREAHA